MEDTQIEDESEKLMKNFEKKKTFQPLSALFSSFA